MANETMSPVALLDAAAKLVERALGQLDATGDRCPTCNLKNFRNWSQAKVHRDLSAIPERLRQSSAQLRNEPQLMGLGDE